jgi:asparagine synthase (glutamine-hydrolysing)
MSTNKDDILRRVLRDDPATFFCAGKPRFGDAGHASTEPRDDRTAWLQCLRTHGSRGPDRVAGDFCVGMSFPDGSGFLAVDRFATRTLCYAVDQGRLVFGERAKDVATTARQRGRLDAQSLFNYLYFHMIPAPDTVYTGVKRVPAGHFVLFADGKLTLGRFWQPRFDNPSRAGFAQLREEFLAHVETGVRNELTAGRVGCFLSGGTDSSTIAGMLTKVTGAPARTYSIGFEAAGYDEVEYSRIAARHFGTDHHEYYVTPGDLVAGIPRMAAHLEQPFGNSSVLPSLYCATIAREDGIDTMLGGDGGDELFGGNARYAKQMLFNIHDQTPALVRMLLLTPLAHTPPPLDRLPLVGKAASYVRQARMPMPDRMESYNLLMRLGIQNVLSDAFVSAVDASAPHSLQRAVWADCSAPDLLNRMLQYDWRFTLADNDLRKIEAATSLAGVRIGYPFLDTALVDFSLTLPPDYKLRGQKLRWFFKEALRGFLPDQIITKRKQGFGLPFGVWTLRDAALKALATRSLESLATRGLFKAEFLRSLISEKLPEHPGYYGEMVWILMMLEQWLLAEEPHFSL